MVSKIGHNVASGRRLLCCVLVTVIDATIASLIQSSCGRVRVMDIKIPTQNGQWLVADLFKPSSATAENPAPLVVVVPGFQRSKEALSNISIELSRRGIVVIAIDPYAQGSSSSSLSTRAATTEVVRHVCRCRLRAQQFKPELHRQESHRHGSKRSAARMSVAASKIESLPGSN